MKLLHEAEVRRSLERRLAALTPDARRRWGRMSVDQMLWHVNESFRLAVGDGTTERMPGVPPLPRAWLRFFVLHLPWPRGRSPTYTEWITNSAHEFTAERARCMEFIERMSAMPLDGSWPVNPTLGRMTGAQWSALQAKHLDHHLKQFGV